MCVCVCVCVCVRGCTRLILHPGRITCLKCVHICEQMGPWAFLWARLKDAVLCRAKKV